jgi:hypothetical protein
VILDYQPKLKMKEIPKKRYVVPLTILLLRFWSNRGILMKWISGRLES